MPEFFAYAHLDFVFPLDCFYCCVLLSIRRPDAGFCERVFCQNYPVETAQEEIDAS